MEAVSLKIAEPQGLFALSNACVTSGSIFVEGFLGRMGCLRCQMHASPVEAVLLKISEAAGLFALSNPCVTRGSSFVEDF